VTPLQSRIEGRASEVQAFSSSWVHLGDDSSIEETPVNPSMMMIMRSSCLILASCQAVVLAMVFWSPPAKAETNLSFAEGERYVVVVLSSSCRRCLCSAPISTDPLLTNNNVVTCRLDQGRTHGECADLHENVVAHGQLRGPFLPASSRW
jgi:hypothetical protein